MARRIPVKRFDETIGDREWGEFLYFRANPKGLIAERWRHVQGCGRFFNAVRHTVTDKLLQTYRAGEPAPDLAELARRLAGAAE